MALPMSLAARTIHWIRVKHYQYEVTFAVYMLTGPEKFIFNLLVLLSLALVFFAVFIYLPSHVRAISSNLWFYYTGAPFASSFNTFVANNTVSVQVGEAYDMMLDTIRTTTAATRRLVEI